MDKKLKYAYAKIANRIRKLIKARIKEQGLIDTGLLYDSIFVYPDGQGGFEIQAEHYFQYLDEPYDLSDYVFNSIELVEYMEQVLGEAIELEIDDLNK
jgi:hypothetical protein